MMTTLQARVLDLHVGGEKMDQNQVWAGQQVFRNVEDTRSNHALPCRVTLVENFDSAAGIVDDPG